MKASWMRCWISCLVLRKPRRILVLARYHHLKPASTEKAATRWPKLQLEFMTIHASKGQQADYVIIVGLHDGNDGFPAPARESIMEEALLPAVEDFPDAEETLALRGANACTASGMAAV